jgi:U3 small nucleolar RNA-associated protein 4
MSVVLTPCASPNISSKKQLQNPIVSSPSCSFEDSYYRKIGFAHPLSVGSGAIQAARSKRVILSRTDSGISLWKIDEPIEELRGLPHIAVDDDASWNKILEMELRISTNLISSAISDDGTWLAVSDTLETKLFHLSYVR